MSNYPDGTWAGDPRAPWNEEDDEIEERDDSDAAYEAFVDRMMEGR